MTLTALLLAGGLSSRMGSDKALLKICRCPMWLRQLEVLRELNADETWISARSHPDWCPDGVPVVCDAEPSRGPLSGLAAAFERLKTTHLLVLAMDLPRITPRQLKALWKKAEPGVGVVPFNSTYFEPLAAIYPREAGPAAMKALARNELSLQRWVECLEREGLIRRDKVPPTEMASFANVNSPDDLERF